MADASDASRSNSKSKQIELLTPLEGRASDPFKEKSLSYYLSTLLWLSWPSAVSSLMWPLHSVIGLYYVGRLGNVKYIDAVSLGNSWVGIFAFSLQVGFACALDTFVSQSFGKRDYKACGLFLNRAFMLTTLATIACCLVLGFGGTIFRLCGIDREVTEYSQLFITAMIPAVFIYIPWVLLEKFMILQQIVIPQMAIQIANTALYPLYCYLFMFTFNMGWLGSVAAKTVSELVYVVALVIYLWITGCCNETLTPLSWDAMRGWKEYFEVALPTTMMICLEWWMWEILNLICAVMGVAQLAANAIVVNISTIVYVFSAGFGAGAGTLVGNSVGEGNIFQARRYSSLVIKIVVILIGFSALGIILVHRQLAMIFTDNEEVLDIMDILVYIYAPQLVCDNTQVVLSKIIIATGSLGNASIASMVSYYGIMLPACLFFAFVCKLSIYGIWLGALVGTTSIMLLYGYLLWKVDWTFVVAQATNRIEASKAA